MSDPSPVDPVAAALAKYAERAALDAHAERGDLIEQRRRELLIRTFAEPVGAAVEPWWHGWGAFAIALKNDRREDAAASLRELAAQLQALNEHWRAAWDGLAEWRRADATPWKADAPEAWVRSCDYGDGWPRPAPPFVEQRFPERYRWQMNLPWVTGGPLSVPDYITRNHLFDQAERGDADGLFLDLRAVFLVLTNPDRAGDLIPPIRNTARVADVAPAVGLCVFPVPGLLPRWVAEHPTDRAVRDARQLFHILPDDFRRGLFDEFNRLTTPAQGAPRSAQASDAGRVFGELVESDPERRAAWKRAQVRVKAVVDAWQSVAGPALMAARAEQSRVLRELTETIRTGLDEARTTLAARHLGRPQTIQEWEHLAHVIEMPDERLRTGDYSIADVYRYALAWADRQAAKAKLAAEGVNQLRAIHDTRPVAAVTAGAAGTKGIGLSAGAPFVPLTSWRDILVALNELHEPNAGKATWKNDESTRDKIRKLNTQHKGPIKLPIGKGNQPTVDKAALLTWWAGLRDHFDARTEEDAAAAESAHLSITDAHKYGSSATVVPGIGGSLKRTRAGTGKKEKEQEG